MNTTNFFAIVGTIFSLYLNFSPINLFIQVIKRKKTIEILPQRLLFFQIADKLLWGSVWILKEKIIPFINSFLSILILLFFIMLYFYLYYNRAFCNALIRFLILFGIIYFIFLRIIIYANVPVISFVSMIFSISIYIIQINDILKVLKEKNYKLINIGNAFVGICCCSSWVIYGKYINFIPQIIVNLIGLIFYIINAIAWIYFFKQRDKLKIEEETVEINRKKSFN